MPDRAHASTTKTGTDHDTTTATLPNGVRVVTIRLPQVQTASVSVFVRSGSEHEGRRLNGTRTNVSTAASTSAASSWGDVCAVRPINRA